MYETMSAIEAQANFGTMLSKTQCSPVQINENGKAVAVVISVEDYERFENLKLQVLRMRAIKVDKDTAAEVLVDGERFFDELESGYHD